LLAERAGAPVAATAALSAAACESLSGVMLADTTITTAALVPAGPFTPQGSNNALTVPAFCRVAGVTSPAIKFEVWMPVDQWNGKFQTVGNGGMAGTIGYAAMLNALNRGYAAAGTDTGHSVPPSGDASWALNRPDLIADFGHRSVHVTAENGKQITRAFYGREESHSYFVGCSKGGQQALMEAQRYPKDFDGIVAGDPGQDYVRLYAGSHLWNALATLKDPESYIPAQKIPILANAVNEACDALDGIKDGILDDPRECRFDPAVLACGVGQDESTCFTPKQVKAVKDIWAGARTSKGERIYEGLSPGGEAGSSGWASWTTGSAPYRSAHYTSTLNVFRFMVFDDPNWDFRTWDYDRDLPIAMKKLSPSLDATDPNLGPLRQRGGKLLVYHGWNDGNISAERTIDYYEQVVKTMGGGKAREAALAETKAFARLFLMPGMQHCSGGPGPNTFDMLTALEQWVEKGVAPDSVVATKFVNDRRADGVAMSRPICAYPARAKWNGSGSTNDAANFTCVNPAPR
jgi:feruloyl esterase